MVGREVRAVEDINSGCCGYGHTTVGHLPDAAHTALRQPATHVEQDGVASSAGPRGDGYQQEKYHRAESLPLHFVGEITKKV